MTVAQSPPSPKLEHVTRRRASIGNRRLPSSGKFSPLSSSPKSLTEIFSTIEEAHDEIKREQRERALLEAEVDKLTRELEMERSMRKRLELELSKYKKGGSSVPDEELQFEVRLEDEEDRQLRDSKNKEEQKKKVDEQRRKKLESISNLKTSRKSLNLGNSASLANTPTTF